MDNGQGCEPGQDVLKNRVVLITPRGRRSRKRMLPRELAVLSNTQDFLFLAHSLLRDGQGEGLLPSTSENPSGPGLVCFPAGCVWRCSQNCTFLHLLCLLPKVGSREHEILGQRGRNVIVFVQNKYIRV